MPEYDAVIVGSGVNSLACAALLARGGWRVCVLERNDWFGGAIKTEELTEPGFLHDTFSAWHPLWVGGAAHAELGDELAARGLEYLNTELPTATAFPDRSAAFLLRTAEGNAEELGPEWPGVLERFFPNADLAFGILGTELWSPAGLAFGAKAVRRLGRAGAAAFLGEVLQSSRDWLETTFASERAHGLLAPWVLHTGLGPDQATSGFMTQVIAVAVQEGGMPVPRGGGAKLAEALVRLIRDHGGVCETDRDVERVLVRSGRAVGVKLTDGETIEAERAVVASVTPTQLHERLLADADVPAAVAAAARRFRYGRSEMQIHYALSEPPRWNGDERLGQAAIVHVTPGLDGVSRAVNEAERGLLPAEATIVVGQPLTIDPSRAPTGRGLLWIQLQELPWRIKGDVPRPRGVDGRVARALRRPDPGAARAAHPESRVLDPQARRARPARPAACERQPSSRRSVRGLARPRPELPLAAVRLEPRTHDPGRAPLADRREHVARPGSRRGLRDDRRAQAPRAAAQPACAGPRPRPRVQIGTHRGERTLAQAGRFLSGGVLHFGEFRSARRSLGCSCHAGTVCASASRSRSYWGRCGLPLAQPPRTACDCRFRSRGLTSVSLFRPRSAPGPLAPDPAGCVSSQLHRGSIATTRSMRSSMAGTA
jgi:phytoene dehydrogenase-like protein